MSEKYTFRGNAITLDVIELLILITGQIAERTNRSFEEAYEKFAQSKTYKALQNTKSKLWSESAEFVVDLYEEEQDNA